MESQQETIEVLIDKLENNDKILWNNKLRMYDHNGSRTENYKVVLVVIKKNLNLKITESGIEYSYRIRKYVQNMIKLNLDLS